jgi:phosphonate degradation associated HDIG domain protein
VTSATANDIVDRIFDLFRKRGDAAYIGEPVSQTEHALQAAAAAERADASSAMITAALLHDIGHLLHDLPEDCADDDIDDRHEELGARWLMQYFSPDVTEPLRLHVAAKRFLCATSPSYHARLSPASIKSLELQGGPFSPAETQSFRENRYALAAVALRGWDEEAKVKGMETPGLEHFRSHLEATAQTSGLM